MNGVTLVLCIHNHQPVGNLPEVFERRVRRAYLPFLETIERFPEIKIVLHNTGPLLEWYEEHAPDYIERVRALVARGQVEVLDRRLLRADHKRDPRAGRPRPDPNDDGLRVRSRSAWHPGGCGWRRGSGSNAWRRRSRESGVEYLPLDDYEFRLAGIEDDDLVGSVHRRRTRASPSGSSRSARGSATRSLSRSPPRPCRSSASLAERGEGLVAVFGDDGEKFGVWPGTHAHVHVGGWLTRFFRLLSENRDWVTTATFAEVVDNVEPRGRAYLPTSSYPEMMEWALPTKARRSYERLIARLEQDGVLEEWGPFVSGGTWKGFLSKYEESNLMVRKMMRVSDKVAAARRASDLLRRRTPASALERLGGRSAALDAAALDEATRDLWRGQCNCAYWHGIFGGLYLPHLRTAIYDHLIRAERLIEDVRGGAWDHVGGRRSRS